MRTLLYIALIFGVLLPSASAQNWDVEKMEQCICASNVTKEIVLAVARGCITDSREKRVTLRLSPSDSDGCVANVMSKSTPGEIDVFMTYDGKLEDSNKPSQEPDAGTSGHQENPDNEMEFAFQVNVEDGKLSDVTEPMKKSNSGLKIRKREIMPFNIMNFNIVIRTDQEATCDLKDQTKPLIIKGIKRYWIKMTFCLLDVTD
ncbi:uncharacterized protein ACMZJ9_015592 [Mantella aurantiaca]